MTEATAQNSQVGHRKHVQECHRVFEKKFDPGHWQDFLDDLYQLQDAIYAVNKLKGFWDTDRSDGESFALIHSEISEALEGARAGNPRDDKVPDFSSVEAELADAVIRIFDYAGRNDLDIGEAMKAKLYYNMNRPFKHGKKF